MIDRMLDRITPLILTYNEAPNIGRTLERLRWAGDIVVVDSLSSDETLAIVARFPQARVFQRQFDSHAKQWSFGLKETGISSEWVLALDADYILTEELIAELEGLTPAEGVAGYSAGFVYCIEGSPLRGSAYPPVTVLYRRASASYVQDGHTQRVILDGPTDSLRARILHDDRKPLSHWLGSQARYMKIEAAKLSAAEAGDLSWPDRVRKLRVVAPFVMLFYCLIIKRAVLDGRAGLFYSFQRAFAEMLLSLYLIEADLRQALHKERHKTAEVMPAAELIGEAEEQG